MVENNNVENNNDSCAKVRREISNYIDGDIDPELRSTMDEHFRACKHCASVLAGTRNVVQLYGDERMLELPVGFSQRLERRLEKGLPKDERGGARRWSSWSAWLLPVAAMVLIAGAVFLTNSLTFRNFVKSQHAEPANHVPADLVVVVSDGSKLFHVPGCPFIHDKNSERTMTAKEATRDGYTPCPRCLRQYLKTSLTHHAGQQVADADTADREEEQEELLSIAGH
ncbi:MAG: zf-HC2 domain-containing protein [Candidatus Sulfotelmatobacter sp.]